MSERPHGTIGRYKFGAVGRDGKNGCRCEPCRAAVRRSEKRHALYGPAYVDGSRALAHMQRCVAAGMTNHQIALLAGLGEGGRTIVRHLLAKGGRLRPATERALLSVPVDPCAAVVGATCDATGTRRRLQALVAIGYTEKILAERLGCGPRSPLQIARRSRCEGSTALAVRRLYDELADTPGPSADARKRAVLLGWLAPLWWDQETIDDPLAEPDVREYDERGRLIRDHTAQRVDEVERLTIEGKTVEEIVAIVGCSRRQVIRDQLALRGEGVEPRSRVTLGPADDGLIDEVAIERALAGDPPRLTRAEKAEVARRMLARGDTRTDVARLLRMNGVTANALIDSLDVVEGAA